VIVARVLRVVEQVDGSPTPSAALEEDTGNPHLRRRELIRGRIGELYLDQGRFVYLLDGTIPTCES
ncbi:MAG: hypothetical protein V3T24_01695, partial [Longimicrobiales bacterium]